MNTNAVWGVAQGMDGREAGRLAVQEAFGKLETSRPALVLAFVSQQFLVSDALAGISAFTGNTPVWGFSTSRPITEGGERDRSVAVAIISGNQLKAEVFWDSGYSRDSAVSGRKYLDALHKSSNEARASLVTLDGLHGNIDQFCSSIAVSNLVLAGSLAGGDYHTGKTFQISGSHCGAGGAAAVFLGGRFRMGVGYGHGWLDTGIHFPITRSRDFWLQELDGKTAAEAYSSFFGYPARDWAFPPLTDLVRLYPLAVETGNQRQIVSPLHVEANGSFRLNRHVPVDSVAHLLTGDQTACVEAARKATVDAKIALGKSRPLLAVVFADQAWQYLFETQPGKISSAVHDELGDVPLIGGYTLGQVVRPNEVDGPRFFQQHIVIALIGEAEG